jgi:hypothetical protein
MKKIVFAVLIAFAVTGAVFAQNWGNPRGMVQSVTVSGTLQLQNGQIAVAQGNTVYFVPILQRYIGFIDGLKEGTAVSISGYVSGNFLQPVQMTLDGKAYDFQNPVNNGGYANYGPGFCGGACYGAGCFASTRGGMRRCW